MDSISIGKTIAALRHRKGLTQSELAEKLNVSNKAVSKWESGQGYPDISLFPVIASLFGVSIDYLMLNKKGIAVAGNIITDVVKSISEYPEMGKLVNISEVSMAVGGCAPNVAISLAKIDPHLSVSVHGRVGSDENGRFVISTLRQNGVNVDGVIYSDRAPTSFTDVMSIPGGERTFFHGRGANVEFSPDDIKVKALNCDILHIGYVMLLDLFDREDNEYGTAMARFLASVQAQGIRTSLDTVTTSGREFAEKMLPVLKYCDYLIVNELEICDLFGIKARGDDGRISRKNICEAMMRAREAGVSHYVIVHAKEVGFLLNVKTGELTVLPSLRIPREMIKGSVGAGDSFCAGALYAIHNGYTDRRILELASAAAASNLFAANSIDGVLPREELDALCEKYPRQELILGE
ncbi:MAG: helix-turn-helix domain-containing protein [Clostridia bacterium]|nr:helix-turn-helix domain-containing protein [Clostridia bacterium]